MHVFYKQAKGASEETYRENNKRADLARALFPVTFFGGDFWEEIKEEYSTSTVISRKA